jgi:hypothetical protein
MPKGWAWEKFIPIFVAAAKPKTPTTPGCYVYTNTTCPKIKNHNKKGKWHRDAWGEKHRGSGKSEAACKKRASDYNRWCGVNDHQHKLNLVKAVAGGKGPLKIGQITYKVSSSWDKGKNNHFTPQINSKQGWSAGTNKRNQWINMTFPKQNVTNVLTQGRINGAHGQYVKEFDLYYKNAANRWVRLGRKRAGTNNGIVRIPVNKVTHEIQLNIQSWSRHITMRAGVEFGKAGAGIMEQFKNGRRLRLKTYNNKYVRMRSNGRDVHLGGAGREEILTVKRLPQFGPNVIALYGVFRRYLRARNDKKTIDQSGARPNYNSYPNGWTWERWTVVDKGGGKIALKSFHNTYLRTHTRMLQIGDSIFRNQRWKKIAIFTPTWI